jgi:ABC-type glycerol-3-phosphate transport system substrate-binding protein
VRQVTLDTEFGTTLTQMSEQFDCFYLPFNSTNADDINTVLSLDPFLDADLEFDEGDMVGNIMQQVERDNRVWAYPLNVQPQVLFYNTDVFEESGVPAPTAGWSTSDFTDALRSIKIEPDDPAPFQPREFGGNYILMLAAAFGSVPLDYSLNPPGINFTDPATIEGLRQVLDLAKGGYIEYTELANLGGGSFGGGGMDTTPIYNQTLNELTFNQFQFNQDSEFENPYMLTSYPAGSQYTPVTYSIGTAYISATAINPEACYRWISHLANNPDLFASMPARRSQLTNPELETVMGSDMSDFFAEFDTLLQSPNIIEFPSLFGSGNDSIGGFILQLWLNRALDRYVLEDADLETELEDAELFANDYSTCISDIPPFDPNEYDTQVEQIRYFQQFTTCAVEVDPSLSDLFPALLVGEE